MMRKITLELLRHGPPHNQLLSPLTEYIALCENHSAVTVRVPFEHNQMLYRLRALSYQLGPEAREFQVGDTARVLGELLGQIPGLTADLNRQNGGSQGSDLDQVTHLRLILSASELALLPFELATSPNGFPGAGQPLSLQTQQPICITRETRRVPEEYIRWPRKARILFAYASPANLEEVPAEAHLLAIRQALAPWLALSDDLDDEERLEVVTQRLSVLPDASAASLERACAETDYTHVHILAHGVDNKSGYDKRFGLALHSTSDPSQAEVVSGERLAAILRTSRRNQPGRFARPAVVTLASCNAGNVGDVTGVGASIGHALHEAGIPLVIASQYPLSFGGSVMLVQDMYEGLLWSEDPRKLVVGLRRRLYSRFKDKHDWASIVMYASLPPNFDDQLADACIQQSMNSINTALRISDRVMQKFSEWDGSHRANPAPVSPEKRMEMLAPVQLLVAAAKERLQTAIAMYPTRKARILAQLASTEKREAQMLFHAMDTWNGSSKEAVHILEKLDRSRSWYWETYVMQCAHPWELVQYVSLTLLLQCVDGLPDSVRRPELDVASLWLAAEIQSLNDAEHGESKDRAWAYGNLAELYLIAQLIKGEPYSRINTGTPEKAVDAVRKIVALAGPSSFQVFSTRRQILRYLEWFTKMVGNELDGVSELSKVMLKELPVCEEPEWDY